MRAEGEQRVFPRSTRRPFTRIAPLEAGLKPRGGAQASGERRRAQSPRSRVQDARQRRKPEANQRRKP